MLTINGWTLLAHPLFLDQVEKLTETVEALMTKSPDQYQTNANTKLLAALNKLVFQTIPADPAATIYRQGSTLGEGHKHWFRAKFGNGRFRLFFRYDSNAKIIIFAWVNDETTLRTYGAKTDAYMVFRRMLEDGNPPDDWAALQSAASGSTCNWQARKIFVPGSLINSPKVRDQGYTDIGLRPVALADRNDLSFLSRHSDEIPDLLAHQFDRQWTHIRD
jgi:toxin YhaV